MPDSRSAGSPLHGVKIIEIGQFIAGPYAGQQLADLGAEVVKIERPGQGDPFRQFVTSPRTDGYGHNFCAFNRNKLGITVDLKQRKGQDICKRLITEADVVLENFRAGVLDRLELGYDKLQRLNHRLIYCSISGFSKDGPYRDRPSFDTIGQALSGILHLSLDSQDPCVIGPTVADQATAMQATSAIIAALFARERTGFGSRIDMSMLDAALSFMPDTFTAYTESGVNMGPQTRASYSHSFVFRCADNQLICIHIGGPDRFWHAFMSVISDESIAANPMFIDRINRITNFPLLISCLKPVFLRRSRASWLKRMDRYDVPASEVYAIYEVLNDPEVQHSKIFETITHPTFGLMTVMRRAARIDNERDEDRRPPPMLGEHTEMVLRRAAYTDMEIQEFRKEGII